MVTKNYYLPPQLSFALQTQDIIGYIVLLKYIELILIKTVIGRAQKKVSSIKNQNKYEPLGQTAVCTYINGFLNWAQTSLLAKRGVFIYLCSLLHVVWICSVCQKNRKLKKSTIFTKMKFNQAYLIQYRVGQKLFVWWCIRLRKICQVQM